MSTEPSAFGLLNPKIQKQLYAMRWTQLRSIQVKSIQTILCSQSHVVISASTASGKTEAAFLPILSELVDDCLGSVRSLYIGPLKALINDQFGRLELLCRDCEIPVQGWHGDISRSKKSKFLSQPAGVLLITPESLESLFINRQASLSALFARLSFVVVDELHSFLGTDRGLHARSLVSRLQPLSKERIRLIGLSATLGDVEHARRWVDPNAPQSVVVIQGPKGEKAIRYQVRGYTIDADGNPRDGGEGESEIVGDPLLQDVFDTYYGKTALIFGNSKRRLEFYADRTKRECARRKLPDRFSVHHGSLSKEERELTESTLKSSEPTVTFCSSTLELGINVGNVQEVGHLGSPWSVSALAQRLGRSGRSEGEPSVMRVYIELLKPKPNASLVSRVYPELVQAIALTELMLEGWCEPPEARSPHLGALVQQILSVIKQKGGVRADEIYECLVVRGAFTHIAMTDFIDVLRSLGQAELIEQAPEGVLILGLKGEQLARSLDFYAVFETPDEYSVYDGSHQIGSLSMYPGDGSDGFLILAGRRWQILSVDEDRKEISVRPAKAGIPPSFEGGCPAPINPKVHQKMRDVLVSNAMPAYLDKNAQKLLIEARNAARQFAGSQIISQGSSTIWFHWSGTRVSRTLCALSAFLELGTVENDDFAITFTGSSPEAIIDLLRGLDWNSIRPVDLMAKMNQFEGGKFEKYLSEDLRMRANSMELFDLDGARTAIETMLQKSDTVDD